MDVERTIKAILDAQAKTEARAAKHEARMEALEQRMLAERARSDSRLELVDNRLNRRIDNVTKLIQEGMKMLVKIEKSMDELSVAQIETERALKTFIVSIKNGRNRKSRGGH